MRNLIWGIFLTFIVFFVGCSPSVFVHFKDDSFTFGQINDQSTVRINIAPYIDVQEFKHSYEKEFGSDQKCLLFVQNLVAIEFDTILNCRNITFDSSHAVSTAPIVIETSTIDLKHHNESLDDVSLNEKENNSMREYLKSRKEDYYFNIKRIDIFNTQTQSVPVFASSPSNNGVLGGGASESCKATIYAELWNVKTGTLLISYAATGDGPVFLFFYKTALRTAISEAITRMVTYLKTGSEYYSKSYPDSVYHRKGIEEKVE